MKVKVITRNPDEYLRETKLDIHKVPRNYDPNLHPFEAAREYTRALNAVKLERVFAKPFIGSLDSHRDSVSCLAKHPQSLSNLASGAYDGDICIWHLGNKNCTRQIFNAHESIVRAITYSPDGESFYSVSDDKTIKTWKSLNPQFGEEDLPVSTIINKSVLTGITHHRYKGLFATCGDVVQLWENTRSEHIKAFKWDAVSYQDVAFNQVEDNVLAACASDNSIEIFDIRENTPVRKVKLNLRSNKLCWNPMEAYSFTVANEDYNLYTFDTRQLNAPRNVHMDHVSAVVYVDYSPTGKEFVSGSYDRTIRLYEAEKGHSRDVYHTKRMQRLTSVLWSLDNRYVLSSSDEINIRIWKAYASEKLGPLRPRERASLQYMDALKEKYATHPQVARIRRHRQVPQHVYNARRELRAIRDKARRKETNLRTHSKPGAVPHVPERQKHVVQEKM